MRKLFRVVGIFLLCFPAFVNGQDEGISIPYINNPYTKYGIGDLINTGYAYNRSMGGSAIALRPSNQINYLNPASYTGQDTMSFLFQGGLAGRYSKLSTDEGSEAMGTGNLEYLSIGFPITRWWKFSVGLTPYSRIKYYYLENLPISDREQVRITYEGNGGFNEFYMGTAFEPIENLSVGMNFGYLFGKLQKIRSVQVWTLNNKGEFVQNNYNANTEIKEDFVARDFYFRFGVQYYPTFTDKKGNKHTITLGATYDTKTDVKTDYEGSSFRSLPIGISALIDTFGYADSTAQLKLPQKIGVGLAYTYNERITGTIQYTLQDFGSGIGINSYDVFGKYSSVRMGVQYVPVPMTDRTRVPYFKRMHYRVGGHLTNTYLKFGDTQIKDYGLSVGLGFPWRNKDKLYTHSTFNLTYEYGVRGTLENNLLKENYHIITIGFTLHDFWFHKPKYD